jgi:hypothetical protein
MKKMTIDQYQLWKRWVLHRESFVDEAQEDAKNSKKKTKHFRQYLHQKQ